jgi:hypothetical protein
MRKGRAYSTHSSTWQELPASLPGFGGREGGGEELLDLRGQRADRGVVRVGLPAGRLPRPGETDRDLITEQVHENEREQANVLQAAVHAAPARVFFFVPFHQRGRVGDQLEHPLGGPCPLVSSERLQLRRGLGADQAEHYDRPPF